MTETPEPSGSLTDIGQNWTSATFTPHPTDPVQIDRNHLAAFTDAAIRQVLWHLRADPPRVQDAIDSIEADSPWLALCERVVTRREREERIARIVDDLTMASAAARRARRPVSPEGEPPLMPGPPLYPEGRPET